MYRNKRGIWGYESLENVHNLLNGFKVAMIGTFPSVGMAAFWLAYRNTCDITKALAAVSFVCVPVLVLVGIMLLKKDTWF